MLERKQLRASGNDRTRGFVDTVNLPLTPASIAPGNRGLRPAVQFRHPGLWCNFLRLS